MLIELTYMRILDGSDSMMVWIGWCLPMAHSSWVRRDRIGVRSLVENQHYSFGELGFTLFLVAHPIVNVL